MRLQRASPVLRYYPPSGDLYFDVMTRLGEAASFDTIEAEAREFEGVRVSVATPRALQSLKRSTVRPLDRRDAGALRQHFGLEEDAKDGRPQVSLCRADGGHAAEGETRRRP